ncbi:MAG: tRNA-(ms[2]io[6]A)-hydroxylase [Acidobacteriota bacterium]
MRLKSRTPAAWIEAVMADFDSFLLDHAACERKASATAMALVAHYPDREELVRECIALAREELEHFGRVWEELTERGLVLGADTRNPYMARLAREYRKGSDDYFLDRLLVTGIIEARGCERFGLVAAALPEGPLKQLYRDFARSEVRHHELFLDLARRYFQPKAVAARLEELLVVERRVVEELPVRAAMY